MLISVIPKLQKFIASRGHSLPTITQALLDGTAWLHSYGPVLLIVVMSVLAALWLTYRSGPGRLLLDRAALRVPVVGGLLRLAGTSAISHGLGLLLGSSITLLDALAVSQTLVGNRAMRRRIEDARQAVLEGRSCAEALRAGREFLPMLPQMVAVGEATGHLDRVFNEIASFHEKQLAASIRRFSALVEPVTILLVGSIVGFVYLAFFLALFSVGGSVR
jgi:type IV pilus assembly protein PilC